MPFYQSCRKMPQFHWRMKWVVINSTSHKTRKALQRYSFMSFMMMRLLLRCINRQATILNSMMRLAGWFIKSRFVCCRKLTANLEPNAQSSVFLTQKMFVFLTSSHQWKYAMNMVFLPLWLFQGFNYSSECRLMNDGRSAISR